MNEKLIDVLNKNCAISFCSKKIGIYILVESGHTIENHFCQFVTYLVKNHENMNGKTSKTNLPLISSQLV